MDETAQFLQQVQATVTALTQRMQTYERQIGILNEKQGSDEKHATGVEVDLKQLNDQYTHLRQEVDTLKNDMQTHFKRALDPLEQRVAGLERRTEEQDRTIRSMQ